MELSWALRKTVAAFIIICSSSSIFTLESVLGNWRFLETPLALQLKHLHSNIDVRLTFLLYYQSLKKKILKRRNAAICLVIA